MVEPVAVALNSLLSGRATLGGALPGITAVKLMSRPSRPALPADFFNPRPRSVKGKERAVDVNLAVNDWPVWHCQEWLCSPNVWCSIHHRAEFMEELRPVRGHPRRVPRTPSPPRQNSASRVFAASQKRHVSHSSEAPQEGRPPDRTPPYETSTYGRRRRPWSDDLFPQAAVEQERPSLLPAPEEKHVSAVASSEQQSPPAPHTLETLLPSTTPQRERPTGTWALTPPSSRNWRQDKPPVSPALLLHQLRAAIDKPATEFDLEHVQSLIRSLPGDSQLAPDEVLSLSDKFLLAAENLYASKTDLDRLHGYGETLLSVLEPLSGRFAPSSLFDHQQQCNLSRALALRGELVEAARTLRSACRLFVEYDEERGWLQAYGSLLLSVDKHFDAARVLDFVVLEWDVLGSRIKPPSRRHTLAKVTSDRTTFYETTFRILRNLENPAQIISDRPAWTGAQQKVAAELLLEVYCQYGLPQDALEVWEYMESRGITARLPIRLKLIRMLAKQGMHAKADALHQATPNSEGTAHRRAGLVVAAYQGDAVRAQSYYNQLSHANNATHYDISMYMLAFAVKGRPLHAVKLLNQFFPLKEGSQQRLNNPSYVHFALVVQAFSRRGEPGDIAAMEYWVNELRANGMVPNVYVYTMMLQGHAQQGDLDAIGKVLNEMQEAQVAPNAASYTTVISVLAKQRDIAGAVSMFRRAMSEHIVPDRKMLGALMDAYAEGGAWQELVRAFEWAATWPTRDIRLSIDLYNQLFKGYVMMGAPFRLVSRLWLRLPSLGVRPNKYTFALLMQSAVDAKKMDIAAELYGEMLRLGEEDPELLPNEYVLSILLSGYQRHRKPAGVTLALRELKARRLPIQPAAYTALVRGHAYKRHAGKDEFRALHYAEKCVGGLLGFSRRARRKELAESTHGRMSIAERMYRPILRAWSNKRRPDKVKGTITFMRQRGIEPTIPSLTIMLDAYRRTYKIDEAKFIWNDIFSMGVRAMKRNSLFNRAGEAKPVNASILCVPLSVYVDALSAAGRHDDIPEVWRACQEAGVQFEGHNWNHLVIALLRAGEVERAFEVVEKVLIPYGQQSDAYRIERDRAPAAPVCESASPPMDAPLDRGGRRVSAQRRMRRMARQLFRPVSSGALAADPSNPLHVLQQIAPSYNTYRSNKMTMKLLKLAWHRLRARAPVVPIGPRPAPAPERRIAYERSTYLQSPFLPHLRPEEQLAAREAADAMRARIVARYPGALAMVRALQAREKVKARMVLKRLRAKWKRAERWRRTLARRNIA